MVVMSGAFVRCILYQDSGSCSPLGCAVYSKLKLLKNSQGELNGKKNLT